MGQGVFWRRRAGLDPCGHPGLQETIHARGATMTAAPPLLSINRSLCLVAVDLDGVQRNGGIGTYNWLTAHLLARHGWKVHILYCGDISDPKSMKKVRARLGRA